VHVTLAEEHPRTDGDDRLDDVIPRTEGIPPRIKKGQDPLPLIVVHEIPENGHQEQARQSGQEDGSPLHAHEEDHGAEEDEQKKRGAQVRLPDDHHEGNEDHRDGDEEAADRIGLRQFVIVEVPGQGQHKGQFHQFRGLE